MGNLQSEGPKVPKTGKSPGKVKGLMKIRGKKASKLGEPQFTSIVQPPEEPDRISYVSARDLTPRSEEPPFLFTPPPSSKVTPQLPVISNDKPQITPNADSSSDSAFTDPQTPVGFATELNRCYYSEESVSLDVEVPDCAAQDGSFLLNNFKLNDHRFRQDQGLERKLSKLGVSRTSQISLGGFSNDEEFVSENVECVVQKEEKSLFNITMESGFESLDDSYQKVDEVNDVEKAKKPCDLNLSQSKSKAYITCIVLK